MNLFHQYNKRGVDNSSMNRSMSFFFLTGFLFLYSSMSCMVPAGVSTGSSTVISEIGFTRLGEEPAAAETEPFEHRTAEETQPPEKQNKGQDSEPVEKPETAAESIEYKNTAAENPQKKTLRASAEKKEEFMNFITTFSEREALKKDIDALLEVKLPGYTRGIYLHNVSGRSEKRLKKFIREAGIYNINTFVVDVQPRLVSAENVKLMKDAQIFPVARIVVFEGGLLEPVPSKAYIQGILNRMEKAAKAGFQEIQLDYIRYADRKSLNSLGLKHKYRVINGILAKARAEAGRLGVYLSADVFGRITLNRHDHIGQKLENFAEYMHTIYPMVYPSHYNHDSKRMSDPYGTVKEAVEKSEERISKSRIVPYIQGFKLRYRKSGLNFVTYIRRQIEAARDGKGDGWVIWNARNVYTESYRAIELDNKAMKKAEKVALEAAQNKTDGTVID